MSLKEKADAMRVVATAKNCRHGYQLTQVVPVLYAYIDELEDKLARPAPAKKVAPAKKAAPAKKKTTKK